MTRLLDLRHEQTEANARDACLLAKGKPVIRKPADVIACMLHQTACWYSVASYQAKASGGDVTLARHRRALGVNAHATAMRHGSTVIAYDALTYVHHGHVANAWSVGLEHEGLYDADGDPMQVPDGIDVGEIIEAGRAYLTHLAETLPALRLVWAHRQSMRAPGRAKTADPGARIFREVGVEHGVKRLGLTIEPDRIFGAGKALPSTWYTEGSTP